MSQTKAQLVQPVGIVTGTGINVTGVITATSFVGSGEGLTGVASTDNIITGTAATFNNTVQVNSTLTANSGFTTNAINTNLKVTGVGTFAGAVSAASFSGDGSALTGLANTDFINAEQLTVVGVVTAATGNIGNLNITKSAAGAGATVGSFTGVTTYYGDGGSLTGVGESIAPWHYNPDVNDTEVGADTGIGFTFNKKVVAGSGTATLKIVNAGTAGTTIQSWGVSSCTFNTTEFTLGALVSNLSTKQTYQLDIPGTFIDDPAGNSYAGTAYTFTATAPVRKLWSVGGNTYGQLGQNTEIHYSSPVQIPGITWADFNTIGASQNKHAIARKTDGTLWAWGDGTNGAMGDGSNVGKSSPIQIGTETTWALGVPFTSSFSAGVKTDGTLWTWGDNPSGNLGHNNRTDLQSPTQLPGTDWRTTAGSIAGGYRWMSALKTDGTLWSMGYNQVGELGTNNLTKYSSPVQCPGTTWNYLGGGYINQAAIRTDGTLWVWGRNDNGQIGVNNSGGWISSPVQVPGTTWSTVSGAEQGFLATKTDGTAWGWGTNNYGQLGVNDKANRSSPIQIPGTNWTQVGNSNNLGFGLKSDGTLWGWGRNYRGAFGNNDVVDRSSPIQIFGDAGYTSFLPVVNGIIANQLDETP